MSTEISTVQPRGLALATFEDAFRFPSWWQPAYFGPKDFRGKPESCLLAIQHGAELGLSPMQSLQSIAVVNGRPSVYGDTALAVCKGSPVCEWVRETIEGEGEHMVAVCQAKRRGDAQPVESRFWRGRGQEGGFVGQRRPVDPVPASNAADACSRVRSARRFSPMCCVAWSRPRRLRTTRTSRRSRCE